MIVRLLGWTLVLFLAVAIGLFGVANDRPDDPDGDGRFLVGYVVADITPPPFKLAQNLAGLGILALGFRINWQRWHARQGVQKGAIMNGENHEA